AAGAHHLRVVRVRAAAVAARMAAGLLGPPAAHDHGERGAGARARRPDLDAGAAVDGVVDRDRGGVRPDRGCPLPPSGVTEAGRQPCSAPKAAARFSISSGDTSSTWVMTLQRWPHGSSNWPARSP